MQLRIPAFGSNVSELHQDAAGSLFGGMMSSVADMGGRVRSATREKAHDEAFEDACQKLKPDFLY